MAVPVLMLFLLVQQLRWLLYRCSESVAAAVIMADGQIAQCMSGVVSPIHFLICSESVAAAVIMADDQIAHARDESVYQFRRRKRQWVFPKLAE